MILNWGQFGICPQPPKRHLAMSGDICYDHILGKTTILAVGRQKGWLMPYTGQESLYNKEVSDSKCQYCRH